MAASTTVRESVVRIAVDDLVSHLGTLEAELGQGRSIELVRGERVIAEVRAPQEAAPMVEAGSAAGDGRPLPDFMGRLKAIYGDKVYPAGTAVKWVREGRGDDGE